jgi:hypothetical protein
VKVARSPSKQTLKALFFDVERLNSMGERLNSESCAIAIETDLESAFFQCEYKALDFMDERSTDY